MFVLNPQVSAPPTPIASWRARTSNSSDRALRYLSAATSTAENALRLVERKVGGVGAAAALTALDCQEPCAGSKPT